MNHRFLSISFLATLLTFFVDPSLGGDLPANCPQGYGPITAPLTTAPGDFYFRDTQTGKRVYLTGGHTWEVFQDNGPWPSGQNPDVGGNPLPQNERFDWAAYLCDDVLGNQQNFIRGWVWESSFIEWLLGNPNENGNYVFYPLPWERAAGGSANDGGRNWNLNDISNEYLDRVDDRVRDARDRGVYVSVMLFEPIAYGLKREHQHAEPDQRPFWTHPFHHDNNSIGVNGDPDDDGEDFEISTWSGSPGGRLAAVKREQEDLVDAVLNRVCDEPNVIWEIGNEPIRYTGPEGDRDYSRDWQYYWIDYIRDYEATHPHCLEHPVWMTTSEGPSGVDAGEHNSDLWPSTADTISPTGGGGNSNWKGLKTNPEEVNGLPWNANNKRPVILDTDHLCGGCRDAEDRVLVNAWVWKSFSRGYHPILMDPLYDHPWKDIPPDPEYHLQARNSMGNTRLYAGRVGLENVQHQAKGTTSPSSTGYAFYNLVAGTYLLYDPDNQGSFTVDLPNGTYDLEWLNPNDYENNETQTGTITVTTGVGTFDSPFGNPEHAVLFIERADDDAEWVNQNTDRITLFVGESQSYEVQMRNTGGTTWRPLTHGLVETSPVWNLGTPPPLSGPVAPQDPPYSFVFDVYDDGAFLGNKDGQWEMRNFSTGEDFGDRVLQPFVVLDEDFIAVDLASVANPNIPSPCIICDRPIGLERLEPEPGSATTAQTTQYGNGCRYNVDPSTDRFIYFDMNDKWLARLQANGATSVRVTIDLYDLGTGWARLHYSTTSGIHTTTTFQFQDTGDLVQMIREIDAVDFVSDLGNGLAEMRFTRVSGEPFCVDKITIEAVPGS